MTDRPCLLISACLLGEPCRYDGRSKPHPGVAALSERYTLIPVCPERDGGLPTPRHPAERLGDRVIDDLGRDVTAAYQRGAALALSAAQSHRVVAALLKERSPSCGSGEIYDGSFSRRLIPGDGVTTQTLRANGIPVCGESALREGDLLL